MSDFDGALMAIGIMFVVISIPMIFRPDRIPQHSLRNNAARLRELDAGAPEAYFEERRALKAYPPRFNPSSETVRAFGIAQFLCGLVAIVWSLSK